MTELNGDQCSFAGAFLVPPPCLKQSSLRFYLPRTGRPMDYSSTLPRYQPAFLEAEPNPSSTQH